MQSSEQEWSVATTKRSHSRTHSRVGIRQEISNHQNYNNPSSGRGYQGRGYQGRGNQGRGYQGRGYQGRGYQGRGNQGRGYQNIEQQTGGYQKKNQSQDTNERKTSQEIEIENTNKMFERRLNIELYNLKQSMIPSWLKDPENIKNHFISFIKSKLNEISEINNTLITCDKSERDNLIREKQMINSIIGTTINRVARYWLHEVLNDPELSSNDDFDLYHCDKSYPLLHWAFWPSHFKFHVDGFSRTSDDFIKTVKVFLEAGISPFRLNNENETAFTSLVEGDKKVKQYKSSNFNQNQLYQKNLLAWNNDVIFQIRELMLEPPQNIIDYLRSDSMILKEVGDLINKITDKSWINLVGKFRFLFDTNPELVVERIINDISKLNLNTNDRINIIKNTLDSFRNIINISDSLLRKELTEEKILEYNYYQYMFGNWNEKKNDMVVLFEELLFSQCEKVDSNHDDFKKQEDSDGRLFSSCDYSNIVIIAGLSNANQNNKNLFVVNLLNQFESNPDNTDLGIMCISCMYGSNVKINQLDRQIQDSIKTIIESLKIKNNNKIKFRLFDLTGSKNMNELEQSFDISNISNTNIINRNPIQDETKEDIINDNIDDETYEYDTSLISQTGLKYFSDIKSLSDDELREYITELINDFKNKESLIVCENIIIRACQYSNIKNHGNKLKIIIEELINNNIISINDIRSVNNKLNKIKNYLEDEFDNPAGVKFVLTMY